jgi:hypothetical protein
MRQQQRPLPWLEITSAQFPDQGRDYFGPSERIERAVLLGSEKGVVVGGLEGCRRGGWVDADEIWRFQAIRPELL